MTTGNKPPKRRAGSARQNPDQKLELTKIWVPALVAIIAALFSSPLLIELLKRPSLELTPSVVVITATPLATLLSAPSPTEPPSPISTATLQANSIAPTNCPAGMVLVEAGWFLFGGVDKDIDAQADEKPYHRVYLPDFCIGRTEVSNAEYRAFIIRTFPNETPPPDDNYPVVNINWDEAMAYCKNMGGRLPTEMEWEKAARGDESRAYLYPWGDAYDDLKANSNNPNSSLVKVDDFTQGASPFGALNMSGNVAEWVYDYYKEERYKDYKYELRLGLTPEPEFAQTDNLRVIRGGSFTDAPNLVRASARIGVFPGNMKLPFVGFRCMATP